MARLRSRRIGTTISAVTLGLGLAVAVPPAAQATDYCKRVTADSLTLFNSATGSGVVDVLGRGDIYFAQRSDGGRYYGYAYYEYPSGPLRSYGWVSNDPRWTGPC